jgi:hypothetical protein
MLVHQQTYPTISQSSLMRTNWSVAANTNTSFTAGPVSTMTPQVGSAFLFGTPGYVAYNNSIPITWDQYTIELWFCQTLLTGSGVERTILQIGTGADNLLVNASCQPSSSGYWEYSMIINGRSFGIGSGDNLPTNQWQYLTIVKASNSDRYTFLNGVRQQRSAVTTFNEIPDTTSSTALTLGQSVTANAFYGVMDQVRISNTARYTYNDFTPPTTAFTNDNSTWYLNVLDSTLTPAPSPN